MSLILLNVANNSYDTGSPGRYEHTALAKDFMMIASV